MIPLMEIMLNSQNGEAFSRIQKQFGLDSKQTEEALRAVLPAFSTGLKRNTTAPEGFGAFMQALSGGRHEKYIDDTNTAFSDEGMREGNGILGHLFGSKDASRAIARHAANASGVGENVIKKMLPVIASMVMGGISKQASGQAQQLGPTAEHNSTPANALGGGILGQILGELAKGGISNPQGRGGRNRSGNNPLGDILEQMMNGGSNRSRERGGAPFGNDNPLGQIFEEMLSGKRSEYQPQDNNYRQPRYERDYQETDDDFEDIGPSERYQPRTRRRPQTRSAPGRTGGGLEDLFGDMFETGREVDNDYQRGVESIFDKFMKR